ncbi:CD276 antigen isoform X2 [Microcaecilia unicolor]|uniref:CD276 antigen isoform X2 n=1 Tax=Microcaecilia unicolor TaxID=1415580 RepID=A0A6P7WXK0_9AMPH|nr:CD276 antigen isoform X2 [Microcaecilia unicolor]
MRTSLDVERREETVLGVQTGCRRRRNGEIRSVTSQNQPGLAGKRPTLQSWDRFIVDWICEAGCLGSLQSCFLLYDLLKMFLQSVISSILPFLLGAVEIQVPELPVVAIFGEDASLDCSFTPDANFSLTDLSVIWQLTDTKRIVHSFLQGQDQLVDQGSGYMNRTALFYDQLPRGNISLLLRRVQVSDEGSFTCFVRVKDHNSSAVMLQVAASYSKPNVYLDPNKDLKPGDLVTVTCHTFRGYPEATVTWQDSRGNNITENVTTSQVANEEGLFDVQSILKVVLEPSSTYSCLVRNPVLQEETLATVTITGQPLAFPVVALWVIVALSVCVLVLLGALAYICRKKSRQAREEEENTGTEEQADGEELKTATQPLKSSETKEDDGEEIC